jgi:hypothetical protein
VQVLRKLGRYAHPNTEVLKILTNYMPSHCMESLQLVLLNIKVHDEVNNNYNKKTPTKMSYCKHVLKKNRSVYVS